MGNVYSSIQTVDESELSKRGRPLQVKRIRRVRGFDQLIVISHDDTFEQGLDCLIRLRKQDGSTRLLSEDDEDNALAFHPDQVNTYAS